MTTRKITRTFELTVEKSEKLSVQSLQVFSNWCETCASSEEFAPPAEIARHFEVTQREIFRLLEKDDIGHNEQPNGSMLICMKCVGSRVSIR